MIGFDLDEPFSSLGAITANQSRPSAAISAGAIQINNAQSNSDIIRLLADRISQNGRLTSRMIRPSHVETLDLLSPLGVGR